MEESHDELVVVDNVGRLQLPKEYIEKMGLSGRSRLKAELEDGRIILEKYEKK